MNQMRPLTVVGDMLNKLKTDRAPRPPRRSLVQILYDTIEAIGGDGATEDQIMALLPAAINDKTDATIVLTKDRLHNNLITQTNAGYFIHDPVRKAWRIAPLSYYEARRLRRDQQAIDREAQPYRQIGRASCRERV